MDERCTPFRSAPCMKTLRFRYENYEVRIRLFRIPGYYRGESALIPIKSTSFTHRKFCGMRETSSSRKLRFHREASVVENTGEHRSSEFLSHCLFCFPSLQENTVPALLDHQITKRVSFIMRYSTDPSYLGF